MEQVRIGVVGIGCMGSAHAKNIADGGIEGLTLTAVCDVAESAQRWAKENHLPRS